MSKYQEYQQNLLKTLYKAKESKLSHTDIRQQLLELISQDIAGMLEVINDLNLQGYTNITAKKALNHRMFLHLNENYLTLKGEEYIENNFV